MTISYSQNQNYKQFIFVTTMHWFVKMDISNEDY